MFAAWDPGAMKTVMGWVNKIVSALAQRKVNKNEGRSR